ncbi:ATP-binding cassette domain-containing protein [Paenibacillus sp. CGMCC 1.16610]|uniref:ATP-binding cassette domain-containing protein n=1 Tax=Paenibacillus anseongense TaxID=2682845 RepID=A0ABW9UKM5_9BACL|nr:ECF transporter S component [Paenibacillus sp. CGMCC 1.16610]MBA2941943.1 ATP-binding cassette domain-containing protein [Paenibacillus sp. CGMCC 1.16610]MVQ38430.1 ATP-binding cassette domain-containing protein [Paenibacillus anseongense]
MEAFAIENLTFSYPGSDKLALDNISLQIKQGEFITLCGKSGCGKSTLLRHFKTVLTPHGQRSGLVRFEGEDLGTVDTRTQSSRIGYVFQSPDNQIVTDKVWHELAFGLESLGYRTPAIRLKVAEIANFFGMQTWFHKSVSELSGGQKQLLNLASVMVMQPSVLILDEPTSQLDPIASSDFLNTLVKVNRELGTTIIISEHRLEELLPVSDKVAILDNGKVITFDSPRNVGKVLKETKDAMFFAMPAPMRIYSHIPNDLQCPITVREGRKWLDDLALSSHVITTTPEKTQANQKGKVAVELKETWFKYEKTAPDIVKGLSISVHSGEIYAILGGNGAGKTTALSLIAGLKKPYRGEVKLGGKKIQDLSDNEKYGGLLGVLPQNPQTLFVSKTVESDLREMFIGRDVNKEVVQEKIEQVTELCELGGLLQSHPYDLSGGEQQRAALAKILLLEPEILLLDEPTKGLDNHFKLKLGEILHSLKLAGTAIIMVSHDVEFCASYADTCAMFFDGKIVSEGTPQQFFTGNSFYTTAASRMSRHLIPGAVTTEDVIRALGGTVPERDFRIRKLPESRLTKKEADFPKSDATDQTPIDKRKLSQRTIIASFMILLIIPLTIWFGIYYLNDRKYYFISLLVILETMLPFVMLFESRKPQARELIVIAVLCAIAVAGRAAFFMVPQFKPVVAMVIISGVCLGAEAGFLVGVVTGFVSNFFFGQGPWTPWQMFAFGIIGFLAGLLFKKGILRRNKAALCIFGGLTTFFIYGGLLNPASVLMSPVQPTKEMFLLAYLQGIPFDLIHAVSTVIFLYFIAKPMLSKLDRIKLKYGLIDS